MRRFRRLLALSWEDRVLLLEAAVALTATRAALAVVPFRYVARRLSVTNNAEARSVPAAAKKVGWAIAAAGRSLPMSSSCLVRAIAGKLMLDRRSIPATVVLGVARPEQAFAAHAWLRSGELILCGADSMGDFSELARFGQ